MIWPYDEHCRLVGENVWEYDESEHDLIKLEHDEVLTTQQAAALLEAHINPLPPFDDSLLPSIRRPSGQKLPSSQLSNAGRDEVF